MSYLFHILATISIIIAMIVFLWQSFRVRRIWFDRKLVQVKFRSVLILYLLVIFISVLIAGILFCFNIKSDLFFNYNTKVNNEKSLFGAILYHFTNYGNQSMAVQGWPRTLVCIIGLLGVLLNGLLVSTFVAFYNSRVNRWNNGKIRYNKPLKSKKFIVIIGDNEAVPNIIKQIFEREDAIDYVVVQTHQDVSSLRTKLLSFLSKKDEERTIIYYGEKTSNDDIKDLHLEYAQEVFIIDDSIDREQDILSHDALNMKCLQIIADELSRIKRENKLICRLLFEHQTSFSIFQFANISNNISNYIDFRPINYYTLWAQKVFVNNKISFTEQDLSNYLPLEGKNPITIESDDFVHIVIVGMSKMGVAIAIEAAHLAHYPNFVRNSQCKTRITFIDKNCANEMKKFQGQFKELFELSLWRFVNAEANGNLYYEPMWNNADISNKQYLGEEFIDVKWEFIEGGIETFEIQKYLKESSENKQARFTLALCLDKDDQNIAASLFLPDEVYQNAVQILVYQRHNSAIVDSISINNKINQQYKQMKAFGMSDSVYDDKRLNTIKRIANVLDGCYYEMYKKVNEENDVKEVHIECKRGKSKAAKQWSNQYNANSIWAKVRSVLNEFNDEDKILALAKTEHNRWVLEQLLMHYRVLTQEEQIKVQNGELNKDELKGNAMAHIDICSFDRLKEIDPIVQQYDLGFIRIIPKILQQIDN